MLETVTVRFLTGSHYTGSPGTLLKQAYQDIKIKVCGLETVSATLPASSKPSYFYYYNTGVK